MIRLEAHGRTVEIDAPLDHIGDILASGVWYESDLLEDLRARIRPGAAIDVGAHVGVHSLWMAVVCRLSVIALEPWAASFDLLKSNVATNRADVTCIHAAAGSRPGFGTVIPPDPENTGMARFRFGSGDVPVVTLDSLDSLDPAPVSVVKIDVEGCEAQVLEGAVGILARDRPVVYTEANDVEAQRRILDPLGYRQAVRFRRYTPRICWEAA